jgi:hypothetical protein
MRILTPTAAIAVIGTILVTNPAAAQTYDPSYPVCLHMFGGVTGGGNYYECRYTSIAQCKASASGRAAMCEVNPFFDPAYKGRDRDRRRPAY